MITLPKTLVNTNTLKEYHFDEIIRTVNKLIKESITYGKDSYFSKAYAETNDIINKILLDFNISVPLTTILSEVKGLEYYSEPLNNVKRFYNSYSGKFCFNFYELIEKDPTKNIKKAGRKKTTSIKGLEHLNIKYHTLHIGTCTDSHNAVFSKLNSIDKISVNDIFVKFGIGNLLCSQAKFYLALKFSQDLDLYIPEQERYSIKDFFSFQQFLENVAGNKNCHKLTQQEQDIYFTFIRFKYNIIVSSLEAVCDKIYSVVNEYQESKIASISNNTDNTNELVEDDLSNFFDNTNDESTEDLDIALNHTMYKEETYGLPLAVKDAFSKLGLLRSLEYVLRKAKNVDTLVDHVTEMLTLSLSRKRGFNFAYIDQFHLSSTSQRDRRYHEFVKVFKQNDIVISELHNELSQALFRRAIRQKGKLTLMLDSTLIKSMASNITNSKLSFSNLDGFIQAFKLILLQTESGLPIMYNLADSSIKDVNDFPSLLLKLKGLNIPLDRLEICADAGFFSEENQAYAESLGCKYYIMSKQVNTVQKSVLSVPMEERFTKFVPKYKVSLFTNIIKFKDYINPDKAYVKQLTKYLTKIDPEYTVEKIFNKNIQLTSIFNSAKFSNEFDKISEEITNYAESIKHINDASEPLPKCKKKVADLFYFDEELGSYVQDMDKTKDMMNLLSVATISSNDTSDPTGIKILNIYKKRMNIESTFRTIKSFEGIAPFRNHFDDTAQYKCFVAWLTALVYNYLKTTYNSSNAKGSVDLAYISQDNDEVDRALEILHKELTVKVNVKEPHKIKHRGRQSKALRTALSRLNITDPLDYKNGFSFISTCSKIREIK